MENAYLYKRFIFAWWVTEVEKYSISTELESKSIIFILPFLNIIAKDYTVSYNEVVKMNDPNRDYDNANIIVVVLLC